MTQEATRNCEDPSANASRIGVTCMFTAALRHVETTMIPDPIIVDHLAPHLCGESALQLAIKELHDLRVSQGPHQHLRVPTRTRILDDWLIEELKAITPTNQLPVDVQVISLGSGLDTRPWRLPFPPASAVHWICMDFPEVIHAKQDLLKKSGAQCTPRCKEAPSDSPRHSAAPSHTWPLTAASWSGLALDLSETVGSGGSVDEAAAALERNLVAAGFRRDIRTFFVVEAVLYYMPLDRAQVLLGALAALSRTSEGTLLATCIDADLLQASRDLDAGHIFAQLWYFDCDGLMDSFGYKGHWQTTKAPRTTKEIAKEDYGKDTYVAIYGGAEYAFVSKAIHP